MLYKFLTLSFFTIVISGCDSGNQPGNGANDTLYHTFSDIQKNIFTQSCATGGNCHIDSTSGSSGAGLDLRAGVAYYQLMHHVIQQNVAGTQWQKIVVPNRPDLSFIVEKISDASLHSGSALGERMPQRLPPLPQNQINSIVSWIKRSALNN